MAEAAEKVSKKEAYHHGDLRQQLVTATRLLVEEKGPMGFSVAEAARKAGVSTAAPYRHFNDRTAMLHAVAQQGMERMCTAFGDATAPHPIGSLEAISGIGSAYVDFASAEPGVFRLMFAAHEEDTDEIASSGEACYGQVLAQVAAHIGHPEIDDAVRARTFPLWTFVHGAAFLTIDGKLDKAGVALPMHPMIRAATERLLRDDAPGLQGAPVSG